MPTILNPDGSEAEFVEARPICGVDFCDACGDCLACFPNEDCPNGMHTWVVYADEVDEFRAMHGS